MTVIKINKTKDYTVMSNYHFKEKEMSLKAKGLLSLMLSLPANWDYSIAGLVSICKENETAIKSTLDELKDFGYLKVIKKMPNETKTGRIEYEYVVYEQKQEGKKQDLENLGVEIQQVENPIQYNNKQLNTKKENNYNININSLFEFWNSKNIIKHKQLNSDMIKAIDKALKNNTFDEIKIYIDRYNEVIKNNDYFFNTSWSLKDFLKQNNAMNDFKDDGSKWVSYCEWKKGKPKQSTQNYTNRDYSKTELDGLFDNLEDIEL